MRIHLVTYATHRFRLRQLILGWSALANKVVDTVTHWSPEKLQAAGFEKRCPGIKLSERGSGFWAWKPFIIEAKLREVQEGDIVFYCDVGRLYPFKMIEQPIEPYLQWMEELRQDIMPGVEIPWNGSNLNWTKRDALEALKIDRDNFLKSSQIQASFSLWLAGEKSRTIVLQWLDLCSRRSLVSDDPSKEGLPEHPEFRAHRHDQSLLTICCQNNNLKGIHLGETMSQSDSRNPSIVSARAFGEIAGFPKFSGRIVRWITCPLEKAEKLSRCIIKFGKPISE
jgi:hypothetical protein